MNNVFLLSNLRKLIPLSRLEFSIPCTDFLTSFTPSGKLGNKEIPAWGSSLIINSSDGKRWVIVNILYVIFSSTSFDQLFYTLQWIYDNNPRGLTEFHYMFSFSDAGRFRNPSHGVNTAEGTPSRQLYFCIFLMYRFQPLNQKHSPGSSLVIQQISRAPSIRLICFTNSTDVLLVCLMVKSSSTSDN